MSGGKAGPNCVVPFYQTSNNKIVQNNFRITVSCERNWSWTYGTSISNLG